MAVAGNVVRTVHKYLDGVSDPELPLSGQTSPANITFQLMRDVGSGMVAASESISFSETATPGYYNVSFTPSGSGLYTLFAVELAGGKRQTRWDFQVLAAGAIFTAAYANAFCAESDVERWSQLVIDTGTKPTDVEAAAFAQSRASEMRGAFLAEGWAVSPTDPGLAGTIQLDMLRECNAIGAAADCVMAKYRDTEPAQINTAAALLDEYEKRLQRLVQYAENVAGTSFIGSPFTWGELTPRDEGSSQDTGLRDAITMDREW